MGRGNSPNRHDASRVFARTCLRWAMADLVADQLAFARPSPGTARGLSAGTQAKPDLLVGRDGDLLALRANDNNFAVTGIERSNYSLEQWLRADGDQSDPADVLKRHGFNCDELACIAKRAGKTVSFIRHPAAVDEECATADIVIAQIPINRPCPNARIKIDRFDLWSGGAHALYFDGQSIRVETVAENRGNRPWSRAVATRKKPATDGNAYAREPGDTSR